ncbi:ABC transporter permease [Tatumella saanichensis]|uniref:ABC transporter permease n=1 Tax=Tatumella saanichensis TaxID=480813 RepID=UPI0004A2A061|nr:ABC transporter permease [Tatumella saanichensis]
MAMEKIKRGRRYFTRAFDREMRHAFRRPVVHWLTWVFPLLLFWLLSTNFSAGTLLNLPVAVVDNDHSQLSRELIRKLDASPHAALTEWPGGLVEAQQKLRSAKDYGILYIPADFESDMLAGRQPQVVFYYNALFYASGLYSTQDFPALMTALNSEYRGVIERKIGKTVPALPQVSLIYHSLFNASGSYIYYQQFAATIHLMQLFVVTCMIYVLSRSKPLIYSSSFCMSLLGKLLPYTLIYTVVLMAQIALLVWTSSARVVGDPFYMFCVAFCYIIAAQSLAIFLFTFTGSSITAYTLMALMVSIAMTFSGLAVPELSMPWPAQVIANLEPLTHALYAMFDLFLRQVPAAPVASVCALLLIYPLAVALMVHKRLPVRLRHQEAMQ